MNPETFVSRWKKATLTERQAAQSHWNDVCDLLEQPKPTEFDPEGETYCFERGAHKVAGGDGWADVWWKGKFAVEYKRKRKNLDAAYQQLLQYREDLGNPPLLIVIDLDRFEVHTNFTGTAKRIFKFNLDDIAAGKPVECVCNEASPPKFTAIEVLRYAFTSPETLKPALTADFITAEASSGFAKIAESMRNRGVDPRETAHFLMKVLFCLFAEDIGLLPEKVFERIVRNSKGDAERLKRSMAALFKAMQGGGDFGPESIPWFNGGLFDGTEPIEMTEEEIDDLLAAARVDWSQVEPSIFGTLFERSLNPDRRSQLGAHYTGREDIMLIVDPVVLRPMRREWDATREKLQPQLEKYRKAEEALEWLKAGDQERKKREKELRNARRKIEDEYHALLDKFHALKILDPACGSGNFLYVALNELKNLEKQIIHEAFSLGVGLAKLNPVVEPGQLYGMEVNHYAHELAQIVVWIGYIQWHTRNGYAVPKEPILKPLNNIMFMDALLKGGAAGQPRAVRPEWPEADFIIGNPPFLGAKKLRLGLGDEYVETLFKVYEGSVAGSADLSVYWHERARELVELGRVKRAGLLATQGIRGGGSQKALRRVLETGKIFDAWSDREWILDGAAVHVSIVCQDNGQEVECSLNGTTVPGINADLTSASGANLTTTATLTENIGIGYIGDVKAGKFDLTAEEAEQLLGASGNPDGRSNSDVVVPWANGQDVTQRNKGKWIVDFGSEMPEDQAALYERPYELVRQRVKPARDRVKRKRYREFWWLHAEPCEAMRRAIRPLSRFVVTPTIAKHRLFAWLEHPTLPDHQLVVFAREDDYFFGVVHSVVHERWALRLGTQLREKESGARYTPTTSFETFPFPWPPGKEPAGDRLVEAIASAAKELNELREGWLNAPGLSPAEARKRTLTNLYNKRPEWLHLAHLKLDRAVFAAYGWHDLKPEDLYATVRYDQGETPATAKQRQQTAEEGMLKRLLALNHERASQQ
ncbi:MAG: class I SAM-dependent DNA methyltransferase [Planctomycetes bacterium]|nr:class I SAM-dependent DNA methyltransferase [Planctomycetota bacterium]MCB9935170.1 class I SAM-dependent DNA methyltransferase [Planctomycetota bacterium]